MKKFEYKTVSRDKQNLGGIKDVLKELNKLGEEGWEVVFKFESDQLDFEDILLKKEKFKIVYLDE